jgi:predicted MPP superfamily phosphohydrolase
LNSSGIRANPTRIMTIHSKKTPRVVRRYLRQIYDSLQQEPTLRPYLNVDSLAAGWSYRIEIADFDVELPGLPAALDGLTVAQVTDVHVGLYVTADDVRQMAGVVAALHPDLIALTGDYVFNEDSPAAISAALRPLAELPASLGLYAGLGNHDYWHGVSAVRDALHACRIPLLVNASVQVAPGLWLAAVDDLLAGHVDVEAALRGIPPDGVTLLLSHNPNVLPNLADRPVVILSGHLHGGQVVTRGIAAERPRSIAVYTRLMAALNSASFVVRGGNPEGILSGRYVQGWYQEGTARMYVSRGLGLTRPPVRINCPAELTLLRLRARRR